MIHLRSILLLSLCFFLFSFSTPEKKYQKFREWYKENKATLIFSQNSENIRLVLTYLPKEISVFREIYKLTEVTSIDLKKLNEKYGQYTEFSFKIEVIGKDLLIETSEDANEYNEKLFYLIGDIHKDFTLITEAGELQPLQCTFENSYGTVPFVTFHLLFDVDKDSNILKSFRYNDQLFGLGQVHFDIERLEKLEIPKIK